MSCPCLKNCMIPYYSCYCFPSAFKGPYRVGRKRKQRNRKLTRAKWGNYPDRLISNGGNVMGHFKPQMYSSHRQRSLLLFLLPFTTKAATIRDKRITQNLTNCVDWRGSLDSGTKSKVGHVCCVTGNAAIICPKRIYYFDQILKDGSMLYPRAVPQKIELYMGQGHFLPGTL